MFLNKHLSISFGQKTSFLRYNLNTFNINNMKQVILIFSILYISQIVFAQDAIIPADTVETPEKVKEKRKLMGGLFEEPEGLYPSPKKALQLSLIFPGAGQIYNKKNAAIWTPFWVATTGAGVFGIIYFRGQYVYYRDIYRKEVLDIDHELSDNPAATASAIQDARDGNRKLAEQALFGTIGIYLLNGLQAFTAAHLLNFDIDDDLSMQLKPSIESIEYGQTPAFGIGMSFSNQQNVEKPIDWLNHK